MIEAGVLPAGLNDMPIYDRAGIKVVRKARKATRRPAKRKPRRG
jgi:hypothetical protein